MKTTLQLRNFPLYGFVFVLLSFSAGFLSTKDFENSGENAARVVADWNDLAYRVAWKHDSFYSLKGIRTLSMVHLAMHDAVNAIDPQFEAYTYRESVPEADPLVAVSKAALDILLDAYPLQSDTIRTVFEKWTIPLRNNKGWKAGLDLGEASAQAILALREGDGHEKQGDYTPMSKPGDYQYTPEWDGWVLKPDFTVARPFALDSVNQFRSPPPPSLLSPEYTASFNEVKEYGGKASRKRSPDQTHFAHWWAEFAEHSWNRIGRMAAEERDLSLHEAARLFALINMDIYDIYLASLESKYFYDTWRPYTAIREASKDNNPQTLPDPDWEPEMVTPPWPEYPSAHASVAAGGAEIVSNVLGTSSFSFTMASTSAPLGEPIRTYNDLDSAARACADSRIMNGYHFRFATEEGLSQGRQVARHITSHFLKPL